MGLIGASLIFYGWWDVRFVVLPVSQIAATWLLALVHERTGRRAPLVAGVVLNVASLGTFKYLDFILGSVGTAIGVALPQPSIILPIGISFFSFQLISYLVDRIRGQAPIYPFRPFALFVLLYPHLIAGPIVRHNELVPQFTLDPRRDGMWQRIGTGLVIFTVGFAKKVLLADTLGAMVDPLFADARMHALNLGEAWSAALGFSFQLFLDFSAYTEMAIGSALIFGLVLPENFRRPYLAIDIRDFWRRWHISLSTFIRDYLYVPLGASRHGPARYLFATVITMALCGLWHGAGWTYVAWGLWHGLGLVVCHGWERFGQPLPRLAGWAVTMLFVLVGWVLFRSASFPVAGSMAMSLFGAGGLDGHLHEVKLLLASGLASALIPSAHQIIDGMKKPHPGLAAGGAVLAVYCLLEVGQGAPISFIYFQFYGIGVRWQLPKLDGRKPITWRKFVGVFLGTLIGVAAGVYLFILLVDPYDIVPFSLPIDRRIVSISDRFMYPQIVRSRRFDSLVIGTSTSKLLDPELLDEEFHVRFANLAFYAGRAWEQKAMLDYFVRKVRLPKVLIVGLDSAWCDQAADRNRISFRGFPDWLYDDNPWNDYLYLFNYSTLEIAGRMIGYKIGVYHERIRYDGYDVFVPPESEYDPVRAHSDIWRNVAPPPKVMPPPLTPTQISALSFPALPWLDEGLARLPSSTMIILAFMPVHVAAQPVPGTNDDVIEIEM